ncbi:DUF4330 domain-containing protein [Spirulina subsalsa]|uniref:DUF4330 domain-containing protein n=1 Tax=Spirulina subsalsa TaxID=54311 RepID=UPI0003179569|nr:DUF4330 domain-containing protein [Spirulina subsalsa]
MNILDSKGRLFGKLSILDFGAAVVILLVIIGIFFIPGSPSPLAQGGSGQPIEVDVIVRGLSVRNPLDFIETLAAKESTNIVLRNQPSGSAEIKSVTPLERQVVIPQPDGSAAALPDPRPFEYSADMIITLGGNAQITSNGPVLGNSQVKVGTPIELDAPEYNFRGTVIEVRILD